MKILFQIALLFCSLAASAQNILFLPFGQTQISVDSFLQTRDYLDLIEKPDPEIISSSIDSIAKVKYYFKTDRLYAVEDMRFYKDKEDAEAALDACLEFLKKKGKGEVYKAFNSKEVQHYVSVDDDKMTELIISFNARPFAAKVHLKSTSRKYGPRMKTESFIADLTEAQ